MHSWNGTCSYVGGLLYQVNRETRGLKGLMRCFFQPWHCFILLDYSVFFCRFFGLLAGDEDSLALCASFLQLWGRWGSCLRQELFKLEEP